MLCTKIRLAVDSDAKQRFHLAALHWRRVAMLSSSSYGETSLVAAFAKLKQAVSLRAQAALRGVDAEDASARRADAQALTLGVLPLAIATGAGSASQRAIGTGVIGGMLTGTTLAVVFVPIFFVVVRSFFKGSVRQNKFNALHSHQAGDTPHD